MTPEVWEQLPLADQHRSVAALLYSSSSDSSQPCRHAAQAALEALPLSATHLAPLLEPLASTGSHPSHPENAANAENGENAAPAITVPATPTKRARKSTGKAGQPIVIAVKGVAEPGVAELGEERWRIVARGLKTAMPALQLLQWKDEVTDAATLLTPLEVCILVNTTFSTR